MLMRKLLHKYRVWDSRRQQRFLEKWYLERSKGKGRYIRRTALAWAGMMLGVSILWDDFYGKLEVVLTLFRIAAYMGGGVFVGWWSWRAAELKYQRGLKSIQAQRWPKVTSSKKPTTF